jgi:hypothetical protein
MKITSHAGIAAISAILLVWPTVSATAAGVRDLTPDEYARMLDLVMDGRLGAAWETLDAVADTCEGRPLYLLARTRLHVETIPVDDDDKTLTKELAEPAYALLDEVIRWCDAGLDQDENQLELRYYRGWAWMVRSQMKAFSRSFYAAGRDAGKGKDDLEAYLAVHPDDGIANGLLGAYLYFTDAVPKLFQFLSKLLFLPTGDRDRGLAMVAQAARADSPARVDYETLSAGVAFFFEGRFEAGLVRNNALQERYPRYPRLAAASAVIAPMDPFRAPEHLGRVDQVLADLADEQGIDTASLATVQCIQGWSLRFVAGHDRARRALADLADDPPPHPDWAGPFARFQLAQMAALDGRVDEARRLAEQVRRDERNTRFAEQAEQILDELPDARAGSVDGAVPDAWVEAVYTGDPDTLAAVVARLDALAASSARAAFHAADARLLAGDRRGAARGFRDLHRRDLAAWELPYRLLAAARLGELAATAGNARSAANWLGRAAEDHQELYRLDWILKGRQRYFEELGEATASPAAPLLFSTAP